MTSKGSQITFNHPKTCLYLEAGVKDRALVLAAYHRDVLKERFGKASFSALVKMYVIDDYKRMKREIEKSSGRMK